MSSSPPQAGASPVDEHSRATIVVSVASAVLVGALMAAQARINGELALELDDGFLAAAISFASGLGILCIALLFMPSGRAGLAKAARAARTGTPWWYFFGGSAGAFVVLSQGLTAAILGIALFTVALVSGQTIGGLVIDRRGLGTMAAKPITAARFTGSVIALVAVAVAVSAQFVGGVPFWMLVLPFLAGLGIGWQQAVNGQVRLIAESPVAATFINFVVGTAVLVIAALVHGAIVGWPERLPTSLLLYLGGLIGVVFIAAATVLVRVTGVLLLGLGTIAGQLLMSLALDVVAPAAGHPLAATTVVGTAITLVAVMIAAIPSRRSTA